LEVAGVSPVAQKPSDVSEQVEGDDRPARKGVDRHREGGGQQTDEGQEQGSGNLFTPLSRVSTYKIAIIATVAAGTWPMKRVSCHTSQSSVSSFRRGPHRVGIRR
jgi:hypothetical protein